MSGIVRMSRTVQSLGVSPAAMAGERSCAFCPGMRTVKLSYQKLKVYIWYNFYTMRFEYDPNKSQTNLEKHGVDFKQAQAIWEDENRLEIPARTVDEARFLVIGMVAGKCWSAVITYRGDNIRIISIRRSRIEEVALYESI